MYAKLSNYYDPPLRWMTPASVVRFEKPSFSDLNLVRFGPNLQVDFDLAPFDAVREIVHIFPSCRYPIPSIARLLS